MVAKDIHGPNFKKMRMVWLSSGNQVGIEIFEYLDPKAERRINDPNIEELCRKSTTFMQVVVVVVDSFHCNCNYCK
jgi:hypothetical protein